MNDKAKAAGTVLGGLILIALAYTLTFALGTYAWNSILCSHWTLPSLHWYEIAILYFAIHLFFYPSVFNVAKKQ